MATANTSTVQQLFNILYPKGIEDLVMKASPTLGMLMKKQKFNNMTGSSKELLWRVRRGGQASPVLATAQANAGIPTYRRPAVTRSRLYTVRYIDHESMEASEGSGALRPLLQDLTEDAMEELRKRAGAILLGNGSGAVARLSATTTVTTATVTLSDKGQAANCFVGQVLNSFTAGDVAVNAGDLTLTAVDPEAGTLTIGTGGTTHWDDTSTGILAGDYLVPKSDYLAVPQGLFSVNPTATPGGTDSWFGVNRSTDPVAMAGVRYAPGQGSIDEVIMEGMATHTAFGGKHDTLILNSYDASNLRKQISAKEVITRPAYGSNGKAIAGMGFEGFKIDGDAGPVACFIDPFMPRYASKLFQLEAVEIWTLNEMFRLLTKGAPDSGMTRVSNADSSELRFGGYWQVISPSPIDMCDITIPQ